MLFTKLWTQLYRLLWIMPMHGINFVRKLRAAKPDVNFDDSFLFYPYWVCFFVVRFYLNYYTVRMHTVEIFILILHTAYHRRFVLFRYFRLR